MLLKISMKTTTFASVLRSSEVSLYIWYRRERVCLFHVYGGFVGFTVWMKVKRPSYVLTMNGASREINTAFIYFSLNMSNFTYCISINHRNIKVDIKTHIVLPLVYDSHCPLLKYVDLQNIM